MLMTTRQAGAGGPRREHTTVRWLLGPSSRLLEFGEALRYVSLWNGPNLVSFSPSGSAKTIHFTLDLFHNCLPHPLPLTDGSTFGVTLTQMRVTQKVDKKPLYRGLSRVYLTLRGSTLGRDWKSRLSPSLV